MNRRSSRWVAIASLGAVCAACSGRPPIRVVQPQGPTEAFVLQATVSTAGPYGESWYLTIAPDRTAFLKVYYSTGLSGEMVGDFILGAPALAEIQGVIEEQRFFDLPSEISAKSIVLHKPDLQIAVTMYGRTATVQLYDPEQLGRTPEVKRFLAVLDSVFRHFPVKPSW